MENLSSIMSSRRVNFEFAFNDATFSDRLLHIEIIGDSFDSKSESDGCRNTDSESCTVVKVRTLHICSLLLAANSPFFQKLFTNGMSESKQTDTTLRISTSEEAGVMDLLNFMYCNTLKATSIPGVLGVLVVADKFEAIDCVRYCCEFLQKMSDITLEAAILYLELPSSVLLRDEVRPLMDAAKEYLLTRYKDLNKSKEEAMTLLLSAFVVLIGSDRLLVGLSGDDAFEMILKWARAQYPELDKRREIIAKNLTQFIPFRSMSSSKLKEVLVCPDLDREQVSNLMLEALIMVVEDHHKHPVIKVEQYGTPQPHCIVYFVLKKEDCVNLSLSGHLDSQSFCLGGQSFYLSAQHSPKAQRPAFGLFVCMNKGSQRFSVDLDFEATSKPSLKFKKMNEWRSKETKYSESGLLLGWGYHDLFRIPWTDFMRSEYFIDGILHLRVILTIK